MALEIHAISTTVSTTVVGGEGHLSAEVDSRAWGFNGGRSQYFQGDDCYVLVYKSSNVTLDNSCVAYPQGNSLVKHSSSSDAGYNRVREAIVFNNPISASSKPVVSPTVLGNITYSTGVSSAKYLPNSTIFKCESWIRPLSEMKPGGKPMYAFAFIEYDPTVLVYKFTNLQRVSTDIFNTPVTGFIFGVATPFDSNFTNL